MTHAPAPNRDDLLARLAPHGQEHLLAFWEDLSPDQRRALADDIQGVDFDRLARLVRDDAAGPDWAALAERAEEPPAFRLDGAANPFSSQQARSRGEQALAAGEVAVVLVAGGQGSRLGFDHPKGIYPVGPVSQASLFQILLEKIVAASRRSGAAIPLGVMTSPATHGETIDFLGEHRYFGLPEQDATIFRQGTMPAVDAEGKLLLAEKGRLFLSPDGHGGMLQAMADSGLLAAWRRRGIKHVFYMQVDNPLVLACDAEFIGDHLLSGAEVSTQVVAKREPLDPVGVVVSVDGQARIIEYSDLPASAANRRKPDGSLELWAGSIAVHVFDLDFLTRTAGQADSLPFHRAHKAVPHVDPSGKQVEPSEPNAIKFERFIFDLLPAARKGIVVEVDEARAFAPLKNGPDAERDSPETVQRQMIALHREWLEAAGATVENGVAVEISALFALDADACRDKIDADLHVTQPTYFA